MKIQRLLVVFCLCFSWLWFNSSLALANKTGIHILEPAEINQAAQLVNSSGGDWGFVTIVIREDDMNQAKWQSFFDDCRQKHLIPIVRLATRMLPNGTWAKPDLDGLQKWPDFLASLNWPVKQQMVVVFNEPNQAKEWGGEISPQEYGLALEALTRLFKERNENFFVLPAGFDQAAGQTKTTMSEDQFLRQMFQVQPQLLEQIDGWASHSYPNHGFVGSPEDQGRASIKGYQWELSFLKSLGLTRDLPVYITETGWPHQEGTTGSRFYDEEKVAAFFQRAFEIWEADEKIAAVTPFVLNYPEAPFAQFSWLKKSGEPYRQFEQVLGIAKKANLPEQIETYQIQAIKLSEFLPTNSVYKGKITLKNTGQWIMGERGDFFLPVQQNEPSLVIKEIKLPEGKLVLPGEKVDLEFELETGSTSAEYQLTFGDQTKTVSVFKPFDWRNDKVSLWQQLVTKIKLWLADLR